MKHLFLILSLSFALSIQAQISINSTDFISGPDTVLISAVTDYQNINYQNTGSNFSWDFSGIPIDSQRVDTFFSVSTAGFIYQLVYNNFLSPSYQASYYQKADAGSIPTGGLPLAIENPIAFEKISNSKYEIVGFGVELNGIDLPISADTIDVVYEFPMTYQDSWVSNSYLFFDLNPTFDAMFKRYQNRSSVVDGYGSITTTYGTFDCIRVKSLLNFTDSLFFDFTGTGGTWFPVPSQPEIHYKWIAKNQKVPLMSIIVTNSATGPEITKVEFRDSYGVANVEDINSVSVQVFPNPANEYITISNIDNFDNILITDVTGKIIISKSLQQNNNMLVNCNNWSKGIYVLRLSNSEKTLTKKIILQ